MSNPIREPVTGAPYQPGQARLLANHADASVYHASWVELLDVVESCDAIAVDAPYGERTHRGHDGGAEIASNATSDRRALTYSAWSPGDVEAFVSAWAPRCRGWFVSITDYELAPVWARALEAAGRYTFAPLPYVATGSRVRMMGDGPPCWTCLIVVARPRSLPWAKWATAESLAKRGARPLRGAYLLPPGHSEALRVVGGKPLWLMERLLEDYSAPGDLVVDPCCGEGKTLRAAQRLRRRAIGGDALLEHAQIAACEITKGAQTTLLCALGG